MSSHQQVGQARGVQRDTEQRSPDHSLPSNAKFPTGFEREIVSEAYGAQVLSAYCIALEGWRRGLNVRFTSPDGVRYELSDGTKSIRFNGSRSSLTTQKAMSVVEDKYDTIEHLKNAGVPVPRSRVYDTANLSIERLIEIVETDYGWPVVLKPVSGSRGIGVFANIRTKAELTTSYAELVHELHETRILLESHIQGDDYRVYVVGGVVAGASRRIPANVLGDGQSTVKQLIKRKNSSRSSNPFLSKGLIKHDSEVRDMLNSAGLTGDSVPEVGQYVQLRQKANASAGGDVEDVTDSLPDDIRRIAILSVSAVPELEAAGVDVIYSPHDAETSQSCAVIELNARAHIGVNMYPTEGLGQNIPKSIVDHFFPRSVYLSEELSKTLALPFRELLQPLKQGFAKSIEVTKSPDSMYPSRMIYEFEALKSIPVQKRRALTRASRLLGVVGNFRVSAQGSSLVIGGTSDSTAKFLRRIEEVTGIQPSSTDNWAGPLIPGFRFL